MSYETYALTNELVVARQLPPIKMKGISHEVVPYMVEGFQHEADKPQTAICELGTGLSLVVDLAAMNQTAADDARVRLQAALNALDKHTPPKQG